MESENKSSSSPHFHVFSYSPMLPHLEKAVLMKNDCPKRAAPTWKSLALSSISKEAGTRCLSPSYERFFGRMQSTLHATRRTPHGALRVVQASNVCLWLVKTRRAPSRHGRDARVYGHTTTAMRKLSTPPPSLLWDGSGMALGASLTWRGLYPNTVPKH